MGQAVCLALRERGASVTILDADPNLEPELTRVADHVVIGDAANLETVKQAGIGEASSVVLTTNDDATNIFLAIYCRKLSSGAHIVSRITHDWNLEAIHRAGADFALSHGTLAVQTLSSLIRGRELVVVGEGSELFVEPIPEALVDKPLAGSGIGARTGLNVIAIRENGRFVTNPLRRHGPPRGRGAPAPGRRRATQALPRERRALTPELCCHRAPTPREVP